MKKGSAKLPHPHEWDFSQVPNAEAELCFLYEYGRNATSFSELVANWRASNAEHLSRADSFLRVASRRPESPTSQKEVYAENGAAWSAWLTARDEAKLPEGFSFADPRALLFVFTPFPATAWQSIPTEMRACCWQLCPELMSSGNLEGLLRLVKKEFPEVEAAQKLLQERCDATLAPAALTAAARGAVERHIHAPALIEKSEGMKRGVVGTVPPNAKQGAKETQICAEGVCHEEATFAINWAAPDEKIAEALRGWLSANRPHDPLRPSNKTSAAEHLKKLGALRVLNAGVKADEASEFASPTCGVLYGNPDEYRRAKREALRVLEWLFPPTLDPSESTVIPKSP